MNANMKANMNTHMSIIADVARVSTTIMNMSTAQRRNCG